jgi:hypothetical protein
MIVWKVLRACKHTKPSTLSRKRLACEPGQVKKHILRSLILVIARGLCIHLSRLYNGAANIILVPIITDERREDVPWELEAFHFTIMSDF